MLPVLLSMIGVVMALNDCGDRRGWYQCPGTDQCVSSAQVCDGDHDCDQGEDEDTRLCSQWPCEHGVRCEDSSACIRIPQRVMCQPRSAPVCSDHSDQAYCRHTTFTGCLLLTQHGLTISHCDQCLCQVRRPPSLTNNIEAAICVGRTSDQVCDGVKDCPGGEDERDCEKRSNGTVVNDSVMQAAGEEATFNNGLAGVSGSALTLMIVTTVGLILICLAFCSIITFIITKICGYKKEKTLLTCPNMEETSQSTIISSAMNQNVYILDKGRVKHAWSMKTLMIIKQIGSGYFSKVFLSEDKSHGFVAIKTCDVAKGSNALDSITNEIHILKNLGLHNNVIRMLDYNLEEKLIVLEYCLNSNCKDYIARHRNRFENQIDPATMEIHVYNKPAMMFPDNDKLNTECLIKWCLGIAQGLVFLSNNKIVHRDVALRNVLLTGGRCVKISDFGLSVRVQDEDGQYWSRQEIPTPYRWSAPESLTHQVYSTQSDVWSFGVLAWEIFSLASDPFPNIDTPTQLITLLQSGQRLEDCPLAPASMTSLMKTCWNEEPSQRPSFDRITRQLRSMIYRKIDYDQDYPDTTSYSEPKSNPIIASRSFYWTNYKILKGFPVPVTLNDDEELTGVISVSDTSEHGEGDNHDNVGDDASND